MIMTQIYINCILYGLLFKKNKIYETELKFSQEYKRNCLLNSLNLRNITQKNFLLDLKIYFKNVIRSLFIYSRQVNLYKKTCTKSLKVCSKMRNSFLLVKTLLFFVCVIIELSYSWEIVTTQICKQRKFNKNIVQYFYPFYL